MRAIPQTRKQVGRLSVLMLVLITAVCATSQTQPNSPGPGSAPASSGNASQEITTFRVNSHLAVAEVVVTDRHGMIIHGLTAQNFRVLEDGREQKISNFEEHTGSAGEAPASVSDSLPPDTYSNAAFSKPDAPLFAVLLDSLNTAVHDQSYAQYELLQMVQGLPKGSRVAVFRLNSRLSILQGFTEDAAQLVATIKSKGAGPQAGTMFTDPTISLNLNSPDLTDGMGGASANGSAHTFAQNDANETEIQSDVVVSLTIRGLKALGLYLSQFPGRKNLCWLAGSFPIDIYPVTLPTPGGTPTPGTGIAGGYDPFHGNGKYAQAFRDLAVLLQTANISVYPIDARGLTDNGLFNAASGPSQRAGANTQNVAQALASFANTDGQIHSIMETLASETGGRAYWNTNDLKGSMLESFNDGSNYYSVSYVPNNQKWDGSFRKLRIQVNRPETKLYYREGYYAEEPGKSKYAFPSPDPSMKSAMVRGSPAVSQLQFQVRLKSDGGTHILTAAEPMLKSHKDGPVQHLTGPVVHYEVTYTIPPKDIQFWTLPSNVHRGNVAFSVIAYNADGKMLNSSIGKFNAPISADTYAQLQKDALHIKMGIDLPPGKVFLRVGVHDMSNEKMGAFEIPVNVPANLRASK